MQIQMDGRKRSKKKQSSPVLHPCGPERVAAASGVPMLRLAGLRWLACWRTPMEEVRILDYAHTSLYDVPGEVFLYERTLEELILDSNRIKDLPRPLFHCHGLKTLRLCDNDLVAVPEAISDLVQLQYLDVSRNALTAFPDTVNACKRLSVINASCNPLLRLPDGITQLISLQELYLNDTDLEFLPANVGRLSKLRILEVRDNRLAALPTAMSRLKQLHRLDIGHNEFQAWPEVISHLTNLAELLCDLNELTTIPPWIGNLQDLTCIDASNNRVQVIAPELGTCFKLTDLRLSFNELQCLPHTIGHLKNLITLKIDYNYLERLPDSIGGAESLEEIVACHNNIQVLTPQVGLLRKLHLLNLDDNRLEELPPEVGSCKNLRVLSVRQNELTSIPPELGHLPVIRVLNLADNHLQNLPVSILNLMTLQALWLSDIQSSPLVQLHQEFDAYLGRRVLTGILLPQQPTHNVSVHNNDDAEWSEAVLIRRSGRIRFSQDLSLSDDEPGVLLRAPTPYPKELRMLAKQARNMSAMVAARTHLFVQDAVCPSLAHSGVNIKEAKVKKPHEGVSLLSENFHHEESECGESPRSYVNNTLTGQISPIYSGGLDMSSDREVECVESNRVQNGAQHNIGGLSCEISPNGAAHENADLSIQQLSIESPDRGHDSPYGSTRGATSEIDGTPLRRHQRRPITREESFRFCREEEACQYASPCDSRTSNQNDPVYAGSASLHKNESVYFCSVSSHQNQKDPVYTSSRSSHQNDSVYTISGAANHKEPVYSGSRSSHQNDPVYSTSGSANANHTEPVYSGSRSSHQNDPVYSTSGSANANHKEPVYSGSRSSHQNDPVYSTSGSANANHKEPVYSGSRSSHQNDPVYSTSGSANANQKESIYSGSGSLHQIDANKTSHDNEPASSGSKPLHHKDTGYSASRYSQQKDPVYSGFGPSHQNDSVYSGQGSPHKKDPVYSGSVHRKEPVYSGSSHQNNAAYPGSGSSHHNDLNGASHPKDPPYSSSRPSRQNDTVFSGTGSSQSPPGGPAYSCSGSSHRKVHAVISGSSPLNRNDEHHSAVCQNNDYSCRLEVKPAQRRISDQALLSRSPSVDCTSPAAEFAGSSASNTSSYTTNYVDSPGSCCGWVADGHATSPVSGAASTPDSPVNPGRLAQVSSHYQPRVTIRRHGSFSSPPDPDPNSNRPYLESRSVCYQNITSPHKPVDSIYNNNNIQGNGQLVPDSVYGTCKPRNSHSSASSIYSNRSVYSNYHHSTPASEGNRGRCAGNYTHESVYGTSQRQPIYGARRKEETANSDRSFCSPRGSSGDSCDEQIVML